MQAHANLGNLLRQSGAFAQAVDCYDTVLQLNQQDWRCMLGKAVALTGLNQQKAAQMAMQQAYQLSGTSSAANSNSLFHRCA